MKAEHLGARIGEAIRRRRKDARLTLTRVARRADISVSHLSNIENGLSIASLPLLAKVAAALNTSLAERTRLLPDTAKRCGCGHYRRHRLFGSAR
ncbi:helix-turn-helix transcriptional regulator [Nesterenkonia salmonea]|uniref:Helix-turn-helix transcriptional regulator n=1 Tax=Nesterenkonia salmonea TaxID=1804987 RepID=A0A5R9BMW4_9MICC|nr:helix-turn-helix transcriptional regulator [Nesterenkonia salmonea]